MAKIISVIVSGNPDSNSGFNKLVLYNNPNFDIEDKNCIRNLKFSGGCNGNLTAIGRLCEGMPKEKAMQLLSGVRCGLKPTSCTNQFARMLRSIENGKK
jgi:uncharacterized protein (TIGR03905 family)